MFAYITADNRTSFFVVKNPQQHSSLALRCWLSSPSAYCSAAVVWFRGAAPSLSHCVQHYFLLTVLLETSLKRNANPLISIPATLLRFFFFVKCIFKLAAVWVFGIWQRRQRKFWGGGGWSSSGRKAEKSTAQCGNIILASSLQVSRTPLCCSFSLKQNLFWLLLPGKKKYSTFYALYFLYKRQMPVVLV